MKVVPFMSVVIITFNGAKTLDRTIQSIVSQDYPSKNFEIIVIDDGSTEDIKIITDKTDCVKYFRQENLGISAARNRGLEEVLGQIYVSMDDDTIASSNFLLELAKTYNTKQNIAGVGASMSNDSGSEKLTSSYISSMGAGIGPLVREPISSRISSRLKDYILPSSTPESAYNPIEVLELYGANGSYPVTVLKAVNGWDPMMSGVEDRDLCYRIKARYPGSKFYGLLTATIIHNPHVSLRNYILRGWKRGPVNLKFYQRMSMFPPIFPYPIFILILIFASLIFKSILAMLIILILPQILYYKWPARVTRTKNWNFLIFPYIQLLEESASLCGLLRGYLRAYRSGNV